MKIPALISLFLFLLALLGCSTVQPIFSAIAQKVEEEKAASKVIHLVAHDCLTVLAAGYAQTGVKPPVQEPGYVDGVYIYPTYDLLTMMDAYVRPRQHFGYVAEAWDCDDMAKEWCILTHIWWTEVTKGKAPVALASFVVYVQVERTAFDGRLGIAGGHALGLICANDGVWWYVEPATGWHVKAQEALFEGSITAEQIIW